MNARLVALLLPSWKLFDHIEDPFVLEIQLQGEAEWRNALPPLRRPWHALFFDPDGNFKRAGQSLIERLAQELVHASSDQLSRTNEYQRVRALAREVGGNTVAQFRIRQGPVELLLSEDLE